MGFALDANCDQLVVSVFCLSPLFPPSALIPPLPPFLPSSFSHYSVLNQISQCHILLGSAMADAAVIGSIGHILRRSFQTFYPEEVEESKQETGSSVEEEKNSEASGEHAADGVEDGRDSAEGGGEEEKGGDGSEEAGEGEGSGDDNIGKGTRTSSSVSQRMSSRRSSAAERASGSCLASWITIFPSPILKLFNRGRGGTTAR